MKQKCLMILMASGLLVIGAVLPAACASNEIEAPAQEKLTQIIEDVTPQQAFELIQENEGNPDFIIIDVRTPQEFVEGHIENAINIDYQADRFEGEVNKLDKGNIYLIYCRTGNRSSGALGVMVGLGFTEVYHLALGIVGWIDEGMPTVK